MKDNASHTADAVVVRSEQDGRRTSLALQRGGRKPRAVSEPPGRAMQRPSWCRGLGSCPSLHSSGWRSSRQSEAELAQTDKGDTGATTSVLCSPRDGPWPMVIRIDIGYVPLTRPPSHMHHCPATRKSLGVAGCPTGNDFRVELSPLNMMI